MTGQRAVGMYNVLLRVYPRSFRDEYGPDMVLLFAQQLRDEPAARIWVRGVVDLAITTPSLHLEHHMKRSSSSFAFFAVLSGAGVMLALIGGSSLAPLAVGLSIAAAAGVLAFLSWRRAQAVATARPATAQWWKLLAGGAGMLAAVNIVTTITGDVSEWLWWPLMLTILLAITSLVSGLILGLAHLSGRRRAHGV